MFRDDYDPDIHPSYIPAYNEHFRWFKNDHGWCRAVVRTYAEGEPQQDYLEWGLSDKEYFKWKLANPE